MSISVYVLKKAPYAEIVMMVLVFVIVLVAVIEV